MCQGLHIWHLQEASSLQRFCKGSLSERLLLLNVLCLYIFQTKSKALPILVPVFLILKESWHPKHHLSRLPILCKEAWRLFERSCFALWHVLSKAACICIRRTLCQLHGQCSSDKSHCFEKPLYLFFTNPPMWICPHSFSILSSNFGLFNAVQICSADAQYNIHIINGGSRKPLRLVLTQLGKQLKKMYTFTVVVIFFALFLSLGLIKINRLVLYEYQNAEETVRTLFFVLCAIGIFGHFATELKLSPSLHIAFSRAPTTLFSIVTGAVLGCPCDSIWCHVM